MTGVLLDPAAAHPELDAVRWAAEERGIDDFPRYVLQVDAADSTAAALLALNLIDIGWAVRSGADRFASFRDLLCQAEAALIDAAARRTRRCGWPG